MADSIYGPMLPKFVDLGKLSLEILHDPQMIEIHEQWAGGIKLVPTSGYGVRLYQNGSSMVMHNDKPNTHVISSIVHIAHQYDNDDEPWSIEIEDHDGELHSQVLKEGEMLFYESAKCLHGRMKALKGKYFGSIFLHYKPFDTAIWDYDVTDVIANVPPHWNEGVSEDRGSRWAGQAITTDSRIVAGAPPRVVLESEGEERRAQGREQGREQKDMDIDVDVDLDADVDAYDEYTARNGEREAL